MAGAIQKTFQVLLKELIRGVKRYGHGLFFGPDGASGLFNFEGTGE
jgi:hypothetical protein